MGDNADRDYGYLGIAVLDAPWAPFTIDFNLANIGGPSAGLMFSLAVIDKLTTGDLNGAKFVAGTGTISEDGKVGPDRRHHPQDDGRPGGRGDGVPGARRELRRGPHRQNDTMELVKVATLDQAVDSLHTSPPAGVRPAARCVELWPWCTRSSSQRPEKNQEPDP